MKSNIYLNPETKKIVRKAMNRAQRRAMDNGELITIIIERKSLKRLLRWGAEDNKVTLILGKNCKVIANSLDKLAYNCNKKEAANAVDYFVYGDKQKYEINVLQLHRALYSKSLITFESDRQMYRYPSILVKDIYGTTSQLEGISLIPKCYYDGMAQWII